MASFLGHLPSGDPTDQPAAGPGWHCHRQPRFAEGVKSGWLKCIYLQMPKGIGQEGKGGARCKPGLAAAGRLLGRLSRVIRHQFGDVLMLGRVQPGLPEGLGLALASQGMLAWLGLGGKIPEGQLQKCRARLCAGLCNDTSRGVRGGKRWILCPWEARKSCGCSDPVLATALHGGQETARSFCQHICDTLLPAPRFPWPERTDTVALSLRWFHFPDLIS